MRAGRLNKRVVVRRPVSAKDPLGGPITDYADVQTCWAGIEPLRGREFFAAQAAHSDATIRVVLRYSSVVAGIASGWRVVYGLRTLEVRYPMNTNEDNRELVVMCRELTT